MSQLDDFIKELTRIGGKAYPVKNLEQAAHIFSDILKELKDSAPRVRWATPLLESMDKDAIALSAHLSREEIIRLCSQAQIGLTEVDYGIAETGSLVLESGPGRSRLASLLPPVHIALLPESRIFPSLVSFTERYIDSRETHHLQGMSCLTFISGPSRTADIEMTITLGVHGPQALHTILLLGS